MFFRNYHFNRLHQEPCWFFVLPSRYFIALGLHITINEQGVIKEC